MIMSMIRPETEMKDSGIEWIGNIPRNWKLRKINSLFETIGSGTTPNSNIEGYYQGMVNWLQSGDINGTIVKSTKKHISSEIVSNTSALTVYKSPFIAIAMYGASVGNISIVDIDACTNQACCVLVKPIEDIYMQFAFWELMVAKEELVLSSRGGGQPNISQNIIKQLRIPVPHILEQQAIADYLDKTCSKIDEIIAEVKASIDEYKELKQSVIFEAVTKGLDKNVEMKEIDGWIRWLPKGWNFRKINGLFNVIGSGTTPKSSIEEYYQGTINWLQSGDINGTVVKNTKKHISDEIVENTSALVVYDAPFIAIAMYGASIGNISIVDINACTNQACCVLSQPTKDIDMGYSFWCIMSAKEELLLSSRGGGQPNISQNIIKQLRIPLPPLMEQRKIVDYLNDKTKEMDSLIIEKESLINDLEAYKKSLIYEVVTGKRRVV